MLGLIQRGEGIIQKIHISQNLQVPEDLTQEIWVWADGGNHTLRSSYPDYAALFLSDLPSETDRRQRDYLRGYMNRRMGELRQLQHSDVSKKHVDWIDEMWTDMRRQAGHPPWHQQTADRRGVHR